MITNPQSRNRLGHFLTPDCKSGGTPSGKVKRSKVTFDKSEKVKVKR